MDGNDGSDRVRIVCICGSTRYREEIQRAGRAETLAGRIVLAPVVFSQADGEVLDADTRERLAALHLAKIDLADEVLVVVVDGVTGSATTAEVTYATSLGKPIRIWSADAAHPAVPGAVSPLPALQQSHEAQRLVTNGPNFSPPDLLPILEGHGYVAPG
jgi:nucleoside 2-deoxyribosyltransferase